MEHGVIGLEIVEEIGSTSEALKARAGTGAGEVALLARRQVAGHGRHGRAWQSLEGNLHLSVLLRPGALAMPGHWSLLAGVALAEAVGVVAPGLRGVRLKWPNDLMVGDGKLAGILLEAGADGAPWLVMGFGVNLVVAPVGLGRRTVCIGAGAPSAEALARILLERLGAWRRRYDKEGFAVVRGAWLAVGPVLGTWVSVTGGGSQEGRFAGIGEDGALLLEGAGGIVRVVAGEVEG